MMSRKLLYIITAAPYSNPIGQEALDAILIGAAFEQQVSVLFLHDGVFQLKQLPRSKGGARKRYTKAFAALPDFGVQSIYVDRLSLQARALQTDELMTAVTQLDSAQIKELIQQQYRVWTF